MKKLALAVSILAASSAAASAADLAPRTYTKAPIIPPAFSWTGFYFGANAGGVCGGQVGVGGITDAVIISVKVESGRRRRKLAVGFVVIVQGQADLMEVILTLRLCGGFADLLDGG